MMAGKENRPAFTVAAFLSAGGPESRSWPGPWNSRFLGRAGLCPPASQPWIHLCLCSSEEHHHSGSMGLLLSAASCGAGQPGESYQQQGQLHSPALRASCSEAGGRGCPSPTRVQGRLKQGRHEGPPGTNSGAFLDKEEQTASLRLQEPNLIP